MENLLDLSDDRVLERLGVTRAMLVRTQGERADIYEMTNILATWARSRGYNGLIVPGARGDQNYNNVIIFTQEYANKILPTRTP